MTLERFTRLNGYDVGGYHKKLLPMSDSLANIHTMRGSIRQERQGHHGALDFAVGFILMLGAGLAPGLRPGAAFAGQAGGATGIASESKTPFQVLKGKWLRPDGGYVIEVKDLDESGRMQAAYLNPRPINVFKAEATRDSGKIKVFIELRDTGYAGSTYDLTYDPKEDLLMGVYFQADVQQNFDVFFTRMK